MNKFDTRQKIHAARSLPSLDSAFPEALIVVTSADPLTVALSRRLAGLAAGAAGKPLVVALLDPSDAILPLRARAELVSALAAVDAVITGVSEDQLNAVPAMRLIRESAADETRRRDLMASVHARHALAAPPPSGSPS